MNVVFDLPLSSSLSIVNISKHLSNTVWYRPLIEINQILNNNFNLGLGLLSTTLVSSDRFLYSKNKKNRYIPPDIIFVNEKPGSEYFRSI